GVSREIVLPQLEAGLSRERGGEIGVRRRGIRVIAIGRGRLETPVAGDGDSSARDLRQETPGGQASQEHRQQQGRAAVHARRPPCRAGGPVISTRLEITGRKWR